MEDEANSRKALLPCWAFGIRCLRWAESMMHYHLVHISAPCCLHCLFVFVWHFTPSALQYHRMKSTTVLQTMPPAVCHEICYSAVTCVCFQLKQAAWSRDLTQSLISIQQHKSLTTSLACTKHSSYYLCWCIAVSCIPAYPALLRLNAMPFKADVFQSQPVPNCPCVLLMLSGCC